MTTSFVYCVARGDELDLYESSYDAERAADALDIDPDDIRELVVFGDSATDKVTEEFIRALYASD